LEAKSEIEANAKLVGFNSTLVRLEEITHTAHIDTDLFQFHFGSIGSFDRHIFICFRLPFQFHFGSIGRTGRPLAVVFLWRFNSTLVRLEENPA